jgi:flagellar motility protein MotE (MotC chaperone)
MPKSKTRGSLKEHRKRVQHRNQTLNGLRKKAQAEYKEMFEKTMESLKAQYQAENGEMMDVNAEIISDEIVSGDINQIDVNDAEIVTPQNV